MLYSGIFTLPIDQIYCKSEESFKNKENHIENEEENNETQIEESIYYVYELLKENKEMRESHNKDSNRNKISSYVKDTWKSNISLLRFRISNEITNQLEQNNIYDIITFFSQERMIILNKSNDNFN